VDRNFLFYFFLQSSINFSKASGENLGLKVKIVTLRENENVGKVARWQTDFAAMALT
jgi:hypothetical protein